jgi:hypothetical protein
LVGQGEERKKGERWKRQEERREKGRKKKYRDIFIRI